MADQIQVLIADDHIVVRSGLQLLLDAKPDISVVGEAIDGKEALALAERLQPDVILMDITMPGMDGLTATRKIIREWPSIKVLALTMHRSDGYFFEMLQAGASGYILKGAETDELIHAIRIIANGEVFLYPSMAGKLVSNYLRGVEEDDEDFISLSPREREIVQLIVEGFSNTQISEKLVISPSTVHTHRSNIMKKLELSSQHELFKYARENKLIS